MSESLFSMPLDDIKAIVESPEVEVPDYALASFEVFDAWLMGADDES